MRTALLALAMAALTTSPAWAIVGGHGNGGGGGGNNNTKYATLNIDNRADAAVDVSVNGNAPFTLQPLETTPHLVAAGKGNKVDVTVSANVSGFPAISDTKSATIQVGKTATATISSPSSTTLSIIFSGQGLFAALNSRESGVMLAASGGLLPLLWLISMLGRAPRKCD